MLSYWDFEGKVRKNKPFINARHKELFLAFFFDL